MLSSTPSISSTSSANSQSRQERLQRNQDRFLKRESRIQASKKADEDKQRTAERQEAARKSQPDTLRESAKELEKLAYEYEQQAEAPAVEFEKKLARGQKLEAAAERLNKRAEKISAFIASISKGVTPPPSLPSEKLRALHTILSRIESYRVTLKEKANSLAEKDEQLFKEGHIEERRGTRIFRQYQHDLKLEINDIHSAFHPLFVDADALMQKRNLKGPGCVTEVDVNVLEKRLDTLLQTALFKAPLTELCLSPSELQEQYQCNPDYLRKRAQELQEQAVNLKVTPDELRKQAKEFRSSAAANLRKADRLRKELEDEKKQLAQQEETPVVQTPAAAVLDAKHIPTSSPERVITREESYPCDVLRREISWLRNEVETMQQMYKDSKHTAHAEEIKELLTQLKLAYEFVVTPKINYLRQYVIHYEDLSPEVFQQDYRGHPASYDEFKQAGGEWEQGYKQAKDALLNFQTNNQSIDVCCSSDILLETYQEQINTLLRTFREKRISYGRKFLANMADSQNKHMYTRAIMHIIKQIHDRYTRLRLELGAHTHSQCPSVLDSQILTDEVGYIMQAYAVHETKNPKRRASSSSLLDLEVSDAKQVATAAAATPPALSSTASMSSALSAASSTSTLSTMPSLILSSSTSSLTSLGGSRTATPTDNGSVSSSRTAESPSDLRLSPGAAAAQVQMSPGRR